MSMSTDMAAGTDDVAVVSRRPSDRLGALLYSANAWTIVCVAAAAFEAFNGRHAMNADGISYLEMAQNALRHGPSALVNGYWSPGYPVLIAGVFCLVRPTVAEEFPLIHAINLILFAATVWIFRVLVNAWTSDAQPEERSGSSRPGSLLVPIGFGFMLLIAIVAVPPSLVTPDLAVLATTFLIALAVRRSAQSGTWISACAIGAVCALGYWLKTAMFPLGATLLALLFAFPPPVPLARAKAIAAAAVWAVLTIPLIALISARLGRLSFGETGHLNYAWYVLHWNVVETFTPYGQLVHPPRVLLDAPRVVEFGSPVPGTFPPHYDPSYWGEGTPAHFALRPQLGALAVTGFEYLREVLFDYPVVFATLIGLALARRGLQRLIENWKTVHPLALWSVAWLALYGAVHVENRLVAPAVFLLVAAVATRLLIGVPPAAATSIAGVLAGAVVLQLAAQGWSVIRQARDEGPPQYLTIADGLKNLGLTPATRIAIVGPGDGSRPSFAHAAGLTIAAEIIEDGGSTAVTDDNVSTVKAALARAGIRAIVRVNGPLAAAASEWRRIPLGDGSAAGVLLTTP